MKFKKTHIAPLCLSFWLPPVIRPQSILIGKMLQEWVAQGILPVVMGYSSQQEWLTDLTVYYISQQKKGRIIQNIPLLNKFIENKYIKKLFETASYIIKSHNLNLVFSFSNPQISNILGAMLKQRLGIKFISHFSDPFLDNPYKNYTGRAAKIALAQEQFIIEQSDRIVFVNKILADIVMRKYPVKHKKKVKIIPHCFDKKAYPAPPNNKSRNKNKYIISHIGAFYKQRTPKTLFNALQIARMKNPTINNSFSIRLIGAVNAYAGYTHNALYQLINDYGLNNMVKIEKSITYKESLKCMVESDCLVVIDADIPNSPFLPSKLIDYIGSETEIISITPEKSPTEQIVKQLGMRSFKHCQAEVLADYLIERFYSDNQLTTDTNYAKKFSIQNTTKKLLNAFQSVIDE